MRRNLAGGRKGRNTQCAQAESTRSRDAFVLYLRRKWARLPFEDRVARAEGEAAPW
jgi:hypothetical protein